MKLITINGKDFIIHKNGSNWEVRIGECLIVKSTIKEIRKDIIQELAR